MARAVGVAVVLALTWGTPAQARADDELPCEADAALARAALRLLTDDGAPTPRSLREAAREAGSSAPQVRGLVVGAGGDARVRRFVRDARERAIAPLACGEAVAETGRRAVVVAERAGWLEPIAGGVRGALSRGFTRPFLVVRSASGALVRVEIELSELASGVELPDDVAEEPARIQLVATGPTGPIPVAELVVNGSVDALAEPRAMDESPWDGLDAARRASSVMELRRNAILEAEATAHAAAVCDARRAAHELPDGLDPEARLRARGLVARVVGEAIGRGATTADAMSAVLDSPAHELTVIDRRFSDGGVGIAQTEAGGACVVLLLASFPRYVGR